MAGWIGRLGGEGGGVGRVDSSREAWILFFKGELRGWKNNTERIGHSTHVSI
jgi:hypothetical protein